jgi:CCR4-NOT transcription complex subunit 7/8
VLRVNVDILKLIQLGITFFDKDGNMPHPVATWQFNFKFSLNTDMYADESIQLLDRSGLQFQRHEEARCRV